MKKTLTRHIPYLVPALLLAMGGVSSCNKSTTTSDDEVTVTISNVAVKSFSLSSDSKVMSNLDSVFFSIDLNNGVIFNADSLPKGTNISKLVPVITFSSSVSEAEIVMTGGTEDEKKVDYLENPSDSIDFTRDVKLNVTAADGTNKYTYRLKVNVHNLDSDSLIWDKLGVASLPSRLPDPVNQKSLERDGVVYSLIHEKDDTYTWASTSSISDADWVKRETTFRFEPDVRSLVSTKGGFWILGMDGDLYESSDAETWNHTGEKWITLIGAYMDDYVLGVKDAEGTMMHCHYPATSAIADSEMDEEFPLYNRSMFRTIETQWSGDPTAFFVGGMTATGERSNHTWAFDGSNWATIDDTPTPAIEGASLFKYIVYRSTSNSFKQVAYDAWIVIGGVLANGDYNRDIYISFDNGVTWRAASGALAMPDSFPGVSGGDAIVLYTSLDADLSDAWKSVPTKGLPTRAGISYTLDGYDITWECPYIYMMGGMLRTGDLYASVWRGVLARLTFTPII
ncbi:MAG: hypothetical protein K2I16_04075 [Muribaculaceae bacterium]|nr:hypothetical protein [Muribaculaceae bacterium]